MKAGHISLISAFLISTIGVVFSERAHSAVRVCSPHVTSKVTRSAREQVAKRAAIKDWLRKAKSSLVQHPSWRIANLKVLKCVKRNSVYECIAHGAPCTIKQKAPKRKQVPEKIQTQQSSVDV